ncbi:cytochrome P450 [Pseudovirgaria hyperparasitica]|uniref:Cytochrome P450 n=1 Tax=Pseudovirgaria hyperparasitica TaxID=470096 RepID=A0A6A6WM15_9PEZI|nr:cytochrome P450 [Pseudovirgaria hyperparasitica]KAF2763202.1 cytochrome P450 [Pseudovirgaria hyperparasitica]
MLSDHSVRLSYLITCALVSFLVYKFIVHPGFISPLARIPAAHWSSPFCPLWSWYIKLYELENTTVWTLHQTKGSIVRIGPTELSVNCYEGGIKTIYGAGFDKPDWYFNRFSNYGVDTMFTMKHSKPHAVRKRMLSHVYSKSTVLASPNFRNHAKHVLFDRLLPLWSKHADERVPLDVYPLNFASAMDMFMGYQYGSKTGSNLIQDVEKRDSFLDNFFRPRSTIFWTTEIPRINFWIERFSLKGLDNSSSVAIKAIEDWNLGLLDRAEETILNAIQGGIEDEDRPVVYETLRQKISELSLPQDKRSRLTDDKRIVVASDMLDHLAAAHETSGDTLTYLFYELSQNLELQSRLRAELLSLPNSLTFTFSVPISTVKPPDPKALDALPMLDAIIHETLRRWPSVPGAQPRVTPSPACTLAGYKNIPAGTRVQSYAYCLHRNADVFPDPETWRPERWLNASPTQLADMRRWFWAFSSGGRMCIGSNIAMFSMKHIVAALYTNFRTEIYEAGDMTQGDGFFGGPRGKKLMLKVERA